MPTICPNCLRPIRSEARFCGYCGSNLNPGALDEAAVVLPPAQPGINKEETLQPKPKPKSKPNREKARRTALLVIVILLCMVLVGAFVIHFWSLIGSYLGAIITVFLSRSAP